MAATDKQRYKAFLRQLQIERGQWSALPGWFVRITLMILILLIVNADVGAAVLPEERADAMHHAYSGGGVSIDGPSILLRKSIGDSFSVSANYYVDNISGASIDVVATASPYEEQRTEHTLGMDYLHNKTLLSLSVTNSSENDFEAKSLHVGVSQDFFGDLTTLTLGYSKGEDEVGKTGDELFSETATRHNYSFGITQVATKNLILGLSLENISDQGYLNNPYRSVRFLDPSIEIGYRFETERYPNTRSSNAVSLTANYYLPYRASIFIEGRRFADSWGIDANTFKLGYVHTIGEEWLLELRGRHYQQQKADFYQDLFSRSGEFNFMARDKELSTFSNRSFGLSLSYTHRFSELNILKKASVNLEVDHIQFDYEDFRDVTADAEVGTEPLYELSANVSRLYFSIWY